MSHLLKLSEWKSPTGRCYCSDTDDLAHNSGYWYNLAVVWGMSGTDFINMLVEKYEVDRLTYDKDKDLLLFSWANYGKQHKFLLDTNRMARNKKFFIC